MNKNPPKTDVCSTGFQTETFTTEFPCVQHAQLKTEVFTSKRVCVEDELKTEKFKPICCPVPVCCPKVCGVNACTQTCELICKPVCCEPVCNPPITLQNGNTSSVCGSDVLKTICRKQYIYPYGRFARASLHKCT